MNRRILSTATVFALAVLAGCSTTPTADQQAPAGQTASSSTGKTQAANAGQVSGTPTAKSNGTASAAVGSVYFDYDSFSIKDQYSASIRGEADYLKSSRMVEVQGNADERGSREYNIALGQKRADSVKRALTALGAKGDRIETVSFGEDKPKAKGHDESAWAENRRVDFANK